MDGHEHVSYDAVMHPQPTEAQTSLLYDTPPLGVPAAGQPDPLPPICAEFPGFRIWREITGDRARYIARSLRHGTSPHTVVTDDLDELSDMLREARSEQQPDA